VKIRQRLEPLVEAASNAHAGAVLERDVANLAAYFGRLAPEILETRYEKEIWSLYRSGKLRPETELTGRVEKAVDVGGVTWVVDDALKEEAKRQLYRQEMGQK